MIPLKLEITNFLSYRETQYLDFHGIHLACISGANGAGKSSILDAITWSLFGNSRTKSDDHIVNRVAAGKGETAEIRFTFELEGVNYRVIRQKKVAKSQRLEFQISSPGGKWKTLSESKVRETQAAIENLLRLNYDTFTNASFLLQGKADEFTLKTPNQRKVILAELLGLNEWEILKERVSEHRKSKDNQLLLIDSRLAEIDEELSQRPERQRALASAVDHLNQVNSQLQLLEERLKNARDTATAIRGQRLAVKSLLESVERTTQDLEELRNTRQKREIDRQAYQEILADADSIERKFLELQAAEGELAGWQQKAEQYNNLQIKKKPFELDIERVRAALVQKRHELETQRDRIEDSRKDSEQLKERILELGTTKLTLEARIEELGARITVMRKSKEVLQVIDSDMALLTQEAGQLRGQQRAISSLEAEEKDVFNNLSQAESALQAADRELNEFSMLNEQLTIAKAELENRNARQNLLKQEMLKRREQLDQLQSKVTGHCPLCSQPLSEDHRRSVIDLLESEGQGMAEEYRSNKSRVDSLGAEIPVLMAKVRAKPRIESDRANQQQRKARAEARLQEIEQKKKEWLEQGAKRLTEVEHLLSAKQDEKTKFREVEELAGTISEQEKLDEELDQVRDALTTSKTRVEAIERAQSEWYGTDKDEGVVHELAKIIHQLESEEFAPEAKTKLFEIEEEISAIKFDSNAYRQSRIRRDQLLESKNSYDMLQNAQSALKPLLENLADLEQQITRQESNLSGINIQLDAATSQLQLLTDTAYDLDELETLVFAKREELIAANRLVATCQQALSILENLETQHDMLTGEKAEIKQLIRRLRLLEKACGREGVQALLIEQVLPEIEDDANEILHRLSGGKMQVLFETQRQLKTSDRLAETLDIHIGDDVGERPYENYSGGEKFRVNFAIRLALSRILARRAGARLQTLVIDEGFGSQDPEGRQRLVEAINTIKDDFERILVITHVETMRDKFPTTIEIVKENDGSKIFVSEG